ncbi:surface antigen protein [Trypanosoma theileri]|uniref:Surface antigen protein n=1 Tax=Trypanosoma theileri TaxID=67003 RepID=A0A1X0NKN8_9TRYP|nr:surface antigen protein [Trypanosoma theileri]ORC85078.1 surface antigen protein [Trypanosoma theileri]
MTNHPHRSAVAALLLLLLVMGVSIPRVEAQSVIINPATQRFLDGFVKTIPNLAQRWVGTDYCSYPGIVCDTDGFVRIRLNTIAGASSTLSGQLPELRNNIDGASVRVREINLRGLGSVRGNLPSSWAALVLLEKLDLSMTGVGGSIPDSWNGMRSLVSVAISGTNVCRGLPNWKASSMPALTSVDFSNNRMSGALSKSFGSFSTRNIQLDISGNSFCGCLPDTWTSTTLVEAARAANPQLLEATCGVTNRCTSQSNRCAAGDAASTVTRSHLLVLCVGVAAALALFF